MGYIHNKHLVWCMCTTCECQLRLYVCVIQTFCTKEFEGIHEHTTKHTDGDFLLRKRFCVFVVVEIFKQWGEVITLLFITFNVLVLLNKNHAAVSKPWKYQNDITCCHVKNAYMFKKNYYARETEHHWVCWQDILAHVRIEVMVKNKKVYCFRSLMKWSISCH